MSLEDERVRFYFRHREQIEQWAALRGEAAASVDEWLTQLGPDVVALAHELDPEIEVRARIAEQPFPSYRLTHRSWRFREDEEPASVALEWGRGRTTLRPGATPYVGLRSAKTDSAGTSLRASEPLRATRLARKDTASAWWIGYAYIPAPATFPDAAEDYRETLLEALRAAWRAYGPLVAGALPVSAV